MVPVLSGERSAGFRSGAQACMSGVTRENTPAHIMHAYLESVMLRLGCVLKMLNEVQANGQNSSKATIIASGNTLMRNKLWQREGTSRGVAKLIANYVQCRELGKKIGTWGIEGEPLEIMRGAKAML